MIFKPTHIIEIHGEKIAVMFFDTGCCEKTGQEVGVFYTEKEFHEKKEILERGFVTLGTRFCWDFCTDGSVGLWENGAVVPWNTIDFKVKVVPTKVFVSSIAAVVDVRGFSYLWRDSQGEYTAVDERIDAPSELGCWVRFEDAITESSFWREVKSLL